MGSSQIKYYSDASSPTKLHINWMKDLPDSTKLSQMTIPGTHDTAALYGICFARTQVWTMTQQLESGLRYFDLRLRLYNDTLRAYHGFIDQKKTFDVFLKAADEFLTNNPTEGIIFEIICEYEEKNCTKNIVQLYDEYTENYKNKIVVYNGKDLTLGEFRGKILMNQVFHGSTSNINNFIIQNKWSCNIRAYINEKKRVIKRHFKRSLNLNDGHTIYLSYLSCASDYCMMTPYTAATYCNEIPSRYKGRLGIVLMDYPGEDTIDHLINQNFAEKPEKKVIKNNSIITVTHNDIDKYLHMSNEKGTLEVFCRKEPMTWTITNKSGKDTFKVGDYIILTNGDLKEEFYIDRTFLDEDKGKEIKEGTVFALKINRDGLKYMNTSYLKKDKKKNYLFNFSDNIEDTYGAFFTMENTTYENLNSNEAKIVSQKPLLEDELKS